MESLLKLFSSSARPKLARRRPGRLLATFVTLPPAISLSASTRPIRPTTRRPSPCVLMGPPSRQLVLPAGDSSSSCSSCKSSTRSNCSQARRSPLDRSVAAVLERRICCPCCRCSRLGAALGLDVDRFPLGPIRRTCRLAALCKRAEHLVCCRSAIPTPPAHSRRPPSLD